MTWSEAEYVAHLRSERRAYAWVMRRYGGMTPHRSWAAALDFYPYESADEPFCGLVFHDHSWHWAMSVIHGDRYTVEHPEPADPPDEYWALR